MGREIGRRGGLGRGTPLCFYFSGVGFHFLGGVQFLFLRSYWCDMCLGVFCAVL
jgi:hypothetical protein